MSRREDARASKQAEVRVYPDGPMLIRAPLPIVDQDGTELRARRNVIAICRCGRSRIAPFCDGSHQPKRRPTRA
jgi:hypothetical protein